MSTTTTDRALHDAFLDLVCDDQDLVDAEFDELIAASWTPPPPAPRAVPEPADRPPAESLTTAADPPVAGRSTAPRTRPARQRSPPRTHGKGR
ncbi:hypothetical protein ACTMTJ_29970 [Phytohabitans sp. LJ34]|uniref:hypothetical protein n=1 Tax=Phytohabitans sp. LJ34 TaxID=3452217 RepID=UPI003F89B531